MNPINPPFTANYFYGLLNGMPKKSATERAKFSAMTSILEIIQLASFQLS